MASLLNENSQGSNRLTSHQISKSSSWSSSSSQVMLPFLMLPLTIIASPLPCHSHYYIGQWLAYLGTYFIRRHFHFSCVTTLCIAVADKNEALERGKSSIKKPKYEVVLYYNMTWCTCWLWWDMCIPSNNLFSQC